MKLNNHGLSYFVALVMVVVMTIALGTLLFASSTNLLGSWYVNKQVQVTGAYKLGDNLNISVKNVGNAPVIIESISVRDATNDQTISISGTPVSLDPGEATTLAGQATNVNVGDFLEIALTIDDGSLRVFKTPVQ